MCRSRIQTINEKRGVLFVYISLYTFTNQCILYCAFTLTYIAINLLKNKMLRDVCRENRLSAY